MSIKIVNILLCVSSSLDSHRDLRYIILPLIGYNQVMQPVGTFKLAAWLESFYIYICQPAHGLRIWFVSCLLTRTIGCWSINRGCRSFAASSTLDEYINACMRRGLRIEMFCTSCTKETLL